MPSCSAYGMNASRPTWLAYGAGGATRLRTTGRLSPRARGPWPTDHDTTPVVTTVRATAPGARRRTTKGIGMVAAQGRIDGITSVFYGRDYITVTKDSSALWAHVKPEVFALITEAVTNGSPIVNTVAQKAGEEHGQGGFTEEAQYDPEDEEVVGMIQELLETRIRPAIQEDGGDIEFRGFVDGQVMLKLRGACRTCDSSTVTLKNGIESMLMHYIEEVKGVQQVLDAEEEIAMKEFEKFEEKLKAQKAVDAAAAAGTTGSSSTDSVLGVK